MNAITRFRALTCLAVIAGAVMVGSLLLPATADPDVRFATEDEPSPTAEPTAGPKATPTAAPLAVPPGLASRPEFDSIEVDGVPRPSDIAREEAAAFMRRARFFMGLGIEEPIESKELHVVAGREADPVTRQILEHAVQAWCRGAFPTVYATLERISNEAPAPDYPGMAEWERAVNGERIEVVIERWRAGNFYAPDELRHIADRDEWLSRRAMHGLNAHAAHCEHQGSFEAWAASLDGRAGHAGAHDQ